MHGGTTRVVAALTLAAAGASLAAAPASAAPRDPLRVTVLTERQEQVVRAPQLRLRVAAARPGGIALAITTESGGKQVKVTRTVAMRFRTAGAKTVTVKLTKTGAARLRACGAHRVRVVSALASPGRKTVTRRSFRTLRGTNAVCPPPAAPAPAPQPAPASPAPATPAPAPAPEQPKPDPKPEPEPEKAPTIDVSHADRCDFLAPAHCLMPFPNDHFTVADPATDTGRRLHLATASMPVAGPVKYHPQLPATTGGPFDPTDINRGDGFSPGSQIVVKVPGLDNAQALAKTDAVPLTDLGRYTDADAPVVVLNARTGERHPIWVELDANATSDAERNLLIAPARNFDEGERYVVVLRDLRDADDEPIPAGDAFRIYRDGLVSEQAEVNARRPHMEQVLAAAEKAGLARDDLYLAWDFTVASARSITERMLTMRDDAFAKLGDTDLADLTVDGDAPDFTIGAVTQNPSADIARRVTGTVKVPCYLTRCTAPNALTGDAGRLNDPDGDGIPAQNGFYDAPFRCDIPNTSGIQTATATKLRPGLYGHGLLGSLNEMNQAQLQRMMQDHGFLFCATNWIGISSEDNDYVPRVVTNWSNFPGMAARMNQGMLDFLFLGRLLVHPDGFAARPEFQDTDGDAVIDTRRLFYDGNSQGGIMGGALAAIAPDHQRAALGVPGMNYSQLLSRSVDFDQLRQLNNAAYTDELEHPLVYGLLQMMWDRAEANGCAHHMTDDPLPNTPPHQVLLHVGLGDHQVANITADVEARTIGAFTNRPGIAPGRSFEQEPLWGIPSIPAFATTPFGGSAIVYWDRGEYEATTNPTGTPLPPVENVPPRAGQDPHEFPRRTPAARQQKSEFLKLGGKVVDTCGGAPCVSQPTN